MLQQILRGRITFAPAEDPFGVGYDFTAMTRFDQVLSGVVAERPPFIPSDRRGLESMTDEDTFDADYGRLLAAALERKGRSSPAGFEPALPP